MIINFFCNFAASFEDSECRKLISRFNARK